jgi:dTDP-4-amino-4,6-dideoxygalactose transaminase
MNDVSPVTTAPMPFVDLQAQKRRLNGQIEAAVQRVIDHGQYVLGPEVGELERSLAARAGVGHCILCSSGTDALLLTMMVYGIGAGDAVLVPSFTFVASAEAVVLAGATPVFVDIAEDGFNLDPRSVQQGFDRAIALGLRPAAVIAVDLFGVPADYDALGPVADAYGAKIVADAAQSFGASFHGRPVGALAEMTATSFYPAKPLGCYGDGGGVLTDSDEIAGLLRSLSRHGVDANGGDIERIGINGRMDTIQAAILLQKLTIFDDELAVRSQIAERYRIGLGNLVRLPHCPADSMSVWAQYTICVENRDVVVRALTAQGIPTALYYSRPIHRQPAYRDYPLAADALPRSEILANTVLSLPIHAYLDSYDQDRVIDAVRAAVS